MDLIKRIRAERDQHDSKFAGNPKHAQCLPRFEQTIERLEQELARTSGEPKQE
jgi:hypothetical protein